MTAIYLFSQIKMIPDFDSLYTLFSTILAFLFSIVMFISRQLEDKENEVRQQQATIIAQSFPFSNVHNQRIDYLDNFDVMSEGSQKSEQNRETKKKIALKRVSRTIQDYHFKHNTLFGISFILLGVIAASTLTWLNLPYQIIFLLHAFLEGFRFLRSQISLQRFLSWVLLFTLIAELLVQYSLYIRSFSQSFNAKQKYQREVVGLLQNTTSFIVFGLKISLIILECSRLQYQKHLEQLNFIIEAQNLVKTACNKSFSFFAKLIAPVSQFCYGMVALIFAFLHPSVVFVPMVPLTILGFFTDLSKGQKCNVFNFTKGIFLLSAMAFTCALYVYHLVQLQKNDTLLSKWKQQKEVKQEWDYIWEVIGLSELNKN